MAKRLCIHCSEPKCNCNFKAPNHYDFKVEIFNQSSGHTVAEMKRFIEKTFVGVGDDRQCSFTITVYTDPQN